MRVDSKETVRSSGPYCFGMPKAPGLRARDPSTQHHFLNLQENKLSEVSYSGQTLQAPSLRKQQGPAGRTSALAKANQLALFQPRRTGSQKAPSPQRNSGTLSDAPGLRAAALSSSRQDSQRARPSRPCCFRVAKALFVKPGGWKTGAAARRPGPSLRRCL